MAFIWFPDSVANMVRTFKGFGARFYGSSSGSVGLLPAANAGSTDYTLPSSAPAADGQALVSTVAGVMSWNGPYVPLTLAGRPGGVATLDSNGFVPSSELPAASASVLGGVIVDGSSITITAGVISAHVNAGLTLQQARRIAAARG